MFTDHAGETWLIFSHGFPQEPEGAIIAAKLSSDMKRLVSEPATLFHSGNNRQKFELLICTAIVLIVTKISKEPERKTLPALSINSVQINLAEYHISHNSSGSILIALQVLK